ncbi:MAG: hypothetical protein ABIE74_05540 [Pseudomonadota bacterium]
MKIFFYLLSIVIIAHGALIYLKGFSYGDSIRRSIIKNTFVRIASVVGLIISILMIIWARNMNIPLILYIFGAIGLVKSVIGIFAPFDHIYKFYIWWVDTLKHYNRTQGVFVIGLGLLFFLAVYS